MALTSMRRFLSINMCSVRTKPIPCAPRDLAMAASCGVSALARTSSLRYLSAMSMMVLNCWNSSLSSGRFVLSINTWMISDGLVCSEQKKTCPVVPSMLTGSPSLRTIPLLPMRTSCLAWSNTRSPQPHTHGRPKPRATTAAWLVAPPRAVRMPLAATMPAKSSGEVSSLMRTHGLPCFWYSTAFSLENTAAPDAAPGPALSPLVASLPEAITLSRMSKMGVSSWVTWCASTCLTASRSSMSPSLSMSKAILTAANPVRLPVRV
mmetsp:Transcript_8512/g.21002  ORF Transcript_8512/g.21002 Transcript_8512/m.21002 type:complete len:264 (-) Transcript_8512:1248-2039(-)